AGYDFRQEEEKYESLFGHRDGVMKALELARAEKIIGKSLEADITVYAAEDSEAMKLFREFAPILPTVFIVSKVELSAGPAPEDAFADGEEGVAVKVVPASGEKCVRCWMQKDDCEPDEDGQHLCARCRKAVC
ncbi:MAG: isoleucine--tRNA ligase, partial [Clostridia bacterium]|nr:isoleucine--tRNA ligase [Clostridia bacterium]